MITRIVHTALFLAVLLVASASFGQTSAAATANPRLWKMKTIYNRPDDWVYASPAMNGTQPYWPNSIFRVYVRPAANKIGLKKRIGWHTFRHTFGTILNANGENPKVIQELLASRQSQSYDGHRCTSGV